MSEYSPSGKLVCNSTGPLDAKIVLIGESPAGEEMALKPVPQPLVGPSGRMLNKVLVKAGIDRSQCYVMNLVPVRAPGDKFANHAPEDLEWGRSRFRDEMARLTPRVIVPLGANPTEWVVGGKLPVAQRGERQREGFIGSWRGSVIPVERRTRIALDDKPEDYLDRLEVVSPAATNTRAVIIPTFHPAAVLRQFNWHPWFLLDFQRVAEIAQNGLPPVKYRQWYRNDPQALRRLANDQPDLFALDSELDPWIVSVVTDDEAHVFEWSESFRRPLEDLLHSNAVKIAHRWLHDWAFLRKCLEIETRGPLFDLIGGSVALNTSLEKQLSPHIATRFTWWPYHKWLTNVDQLLYCGMDSVVAFDAYRPMMQQLMDRGLYVIASLNQEEVDNAVVTHDHKLLMPLLHMQAKGFKIDEETRLVVSEELKAKLEAAEKDLAESVEPIIERQIGRFEKPHLFRVDRKCECCGGGKTQRAHCWHCWKVDWEQTESRPASEEPTVAFAKDLGRTLKALKEMFPACRTCNSSGKIIKKLEFNSDSSDQIADVIYRGLRIRPRKFKGKETVKAAQLDPIKDKHPIIAKIVEVSGVRADYDTVARLRAGTDGLLHCEFDPWGAETRVASKEGLLEAGTNAQNLPKAARRFVVPREGYTFLYPDLCVGAHTRILKADLTWAFAKDLCKGDEVIGFDENPPQQCYRRATVTYNQPRVRACVRVQTDKGTVVCSLAHQFPVRHRGKGRVWMEASKLQVGMELPWFGYPWEVERSYDAGWLAGLFDGEGHLYQSTAGFTQRRGKGVWEQGVELLSNRGFDFYCDTNSLKVPRLNFRRMYDTLRFLGQIHPVRLYKKADNAWEGHRTWSKRSQPAVVLAVDRIADQVTYPVSTTTRTFIAEGLLTHNSQVEARAMAVLSGDKNLRKALYETLPDLGKPDYHTWLLRAISDYDATLQLSRDQSKRVSYAGFYGARPEQLAKELTAEAFRKGVGQKVDAKMAQRILDTLYRVCPEVPRWQQSVCDEVLRTRRLKSPTGREFTFNGYLLDRKHPTEIEYETRKQIYSRLPQDIGAWVLGLGLIDIYYTSNEWNKLLTPLIHVHDALLIEVPTDRAQEAETLAVKLLSRYIYEMDFPAEVSKKGGGPNWYAVS